MDPLFDRVEEAGADILGIAAASVLVVVDERLRLPPWWHPAWPLCRGLAALGFGSIQLHGARDCVDELSELMRGAMFTQIPDLDSLGGLAEGWDSFDIVLYLGDDPRTRARCIDLATARGTPFRAVSWGASWLAMQSSTGDGPGSDASSLPPPRGEPEPLPPVACMAAGLALQEALIVAGGLSLAADPSPVVFFDAASDTRAAGGSRSDWSSVYIESGVLEVVGAGGIGTHLLESLIPLLGDGCECRIFDFDAVGPENLSVQSVFEPEDVDLPKAEVMARKLAQIAAPMLAIEPFVMRYEDRPRTLSTPTLRILCPDTFAARAHANKRSLRDGVPLVEAGSSPLVAQQRTYLPGVTACLQHRIPDLQRRVAEERDRASCVFEHAATLPGTNLVSGGLLALEALRALDPERRGPPSTGTIVYDARFPRRFGVVEPRPPCAH